MSLQQGISNFLDRLTKDDLTVAEWARRNRFSVSSVYFVVQGRSAGKRGEARRIMEKMGVQLPPMHRNVVAESEAAAESAA